VPHQPATLPAVPEAPLPQVALTLNVVLSEECFAWLEVECQGRDLSLDALTGAVLDYWTYQQGRRPLSASARSVRHAG